MFVCSCRLSVLESDGASSFSSRTGLRSVAGRALDEACVSLDGRYVAKPFSRGGHRVSAVLGGRAVRDA